MIALFLALLQVASAADLDAALATAWKDAPDVGRAVYAAVPRTTRAQGVVRFVDPVTAQAEAAPFLAERLRRGDDPPEVRRALAERLGRVDPSGGEWLVEHLEVEADPVVRAALVASLTDAEPEWALRGLDYASKDVDPRVRAEADTTRRIRP